MIFDLNIINTPNSERVYLNILSRMPHSFGGIIAIIDTGSPKTIISAKDVYVLKLPVKNFKSTLPIRGFGRGSVPAKELEKFVFIIKSRDGKIKNVEMPVNLVDIYELNKQPADVRDHAYKIDSVIGLDFLRNLNLKLVIELKNNVAYLEEL